MFYTRDEMLLFDGLRESSVISLLIIHRLAILPFRKCLMCPFLSLQCLHPDPNDFVDRHNKNTNEKTTNERINFDRWFMSTIHEECTFCIEVEANWQLASMYRWTSGMCLCTQPRHCFSSKCAHLFMTLAYTPISHVICSSEQLLHRYLLFCH